mmetsp:Transcript_52451/g.83492  ORF Transcript_52451/g.83492 Transcript_52451/m.83492 type:complete len:201 (+) Transcript_52451:418-1020(+)
MPIIRGFDSIPPTATTQTLRHLDWSDIDKQCECTMSAATRICATLQNEELVQPSRDRQNHQEPLDQHLELDRDQEVDLAMDPARALHLQRSTEASIRMTRVKRTRIWANTLQRCMDVGMSEDWHIVNTLCVTRKAPSWRNSEIYALTASTMNGTGMRRSRSNWDRRAITDRLARTSYSNSLQTLVNVRVTWQRTMVTLES